MFIEFPEENIAINTDNITCLKIRAETAEYQLIAIAHGVDHLLKRSSTRSEIELLFVRLKTKLKVQSV